MKTIFCAVFSFLTFSISLAQQQDPILMVVNKKPVLTSEFKRVYLKNIDLVKDESQKDIDEYLQLFIDYKLKIEEAKALGLDQKESYKKEFEGYKKQLSSSYLTDSEASDALIKEAYDRLQERVNANHILILVKPDASPTDTLKAYQKIQDARNKILEGKDFNEIAKQYSEDPSAQKNGGDLGWFSAFRMVYPFEDAAYKTPVNKISEPFRTQYGYHILKVNQKEKTLGEVTVAHIMVAFNKERNEEEALKRIKKIQEQLKQKASFEALAKEYSDDRNTAVNGGKINRFAQGALNSEVFEKAAFALQSPGELSQPIKTNYGYHIIKLIEKHPSKSFEEMKKELSNRVKRDVRSQMITKSFISSLKEKYDIDSNKKALEEIKKEIPEDIFTEEWTFETSQSPWNKALFNIKDSIYTYGDFASYVTERVSPDRKMDLAILLDRLYEDYESKKILAYYESNLERDNADFASIVSEYRDGLLLFDLMETKIWNAAKTDTISLQKFYNLNKEDYKRGKSYKVFQVSSTQKGVIENVEKMIKENKTVEAIEEALKDETSNGNVILTKKSIIEGEDEEVKLFDGSIGQIVKQEKDGFTTLMWVRAKEPARVLTYEEVKGKVINDYQENLEKEWMEELRDKYNVEVVKKNLKKIKKELSL